MRTLTSYPSVAILIGILTLFGCSEAENKAPLSQQERESLEKAVLIPLPSDARILRDSDGGGRDPKYGFHIWLIYSKTGITMAPDKVPNPSDYMPNYNVSDKVKFISSVAKKELPQAQSAAALRWASGEFQFRSTLLKTVGGDYLCIQRFRRANTTSTTPTSQPSTTPGVE